MNVIVSNRQKELIDNANIDAIKDLNGLFNVDDLINKFKNYFFSKMILDATSVVNFATKDVLTTLANEIGADKLIILLPATPEPPTEFKKLLIDLKIFNFTNNINDVIKFIETPNTYEDAIKTLDDSYKSMYVDNSIKDEDNEPSNEDTNEDSEPTPVNNDIDVVPTNSDNNMSSVNKASLGDILSSISFQSMSNDISTNTDTNNDNGMSNDNSTNNEEPASENNESVQNDITSQLNNFFDTKPENKVESDNVVPSTGSQSHTFLLNDDFDKPVSTVENKNKKMVIGVRNVTSHAGSTSLIYMLHKMAVTELKKNVLSIELNRNDFRLFRDNKMISVNENELQDTINNANEDIVFVDLNDYNNDNICDEILYLVEPSTIKLNELMAKDKNIFKGLNDKKVLLNKSMLSSNDVHTLESEAGIKFVCSIEPLNDRIMNDSISKLLGILDIK